VKRLPSLFTSSKGPPTDACPTTCWLCATTCCSFWSVYTRVAYVMPAPAMSARTSVRIDTGATSRAEGRLPGSLESSLKPGDLSCILAALKALWDLRRGQWAACPLVDGPAWAPLWPATRFTRRHSWR
jgi:hypothetical protein